jgi:iron complex transport system ATP-binding protein
MMQQTKNNGLAVRDLAAGYTARPVLRGLSLELAPGEFLGVIGPNGCGKSTLIKAISGVLKPTHGTVTFEGQNLLKLRAAERAKILAVVAQNPSLPPAYSAAEIVLMGRTPHLGAFQTESEADWQIVQGAMEAANCWEYSHRPVGELSGGERQRVLFALALAQQPRLLLLDEPTTYLDINHQIGVMEIARQWLHAEPGRAALGVFHDLNLAAQYCDRLVLLAKGQVVASGAPADVITVENIRQAYGASVIVAPHPLNELPTTFIMPHK